MVKKYIMYAEKVAARYDPHSNPMWGVITPTALLKFGKYVIYTYTACFDTIFLLIQQRDDIIIQIQLSKITGKLDVDVESEEFSKYLCFFFIWRSILNSIRELSI